MRSFGDSGLNVRPPLRQFLLDFARRRAQQQEIVSGAKARMIEQTQRASTFATLEARLQADDLAHRQRESLRHGDARLLTRSDPIARSEQRLNSRRLCRRLAARTPAESTGHSSTANRNVGVTDLSARTRSSVPCSPTRSTCTAVLSGAS